MQSTNIIRFPIFGREIFTPQDSIHTNFDFPFLPADRPRSKLVGAIRFTAPNSLICCIDGYKLFSPFCLELRSAVRWMSFRGMLGKSSTSMSELCPITITAFLVCIDLLACINKMLFRGLLFGLRFDLYCFLRDWCWSCIFFTHSRPHIDMRWNDRAVKIASRLSQTADLTLTSGGMTEQ